MEQIWLKKVIFIKRSLYLTVVHETGNLKKKSCASVSSGAPNGICKISQTGGKQPIRAELEPAVSEQLSITRKLRSNGQTRQRWSNMNQYSVTVMPISLLKCFQKHLVVYCLAVKWESLWPGSHVEISWGNTKHRPPAGAQPIGTL